MADIRLLPPGLRDDRSRAVLEMAEKLGTLNLTALKMWDIDNVPSSALPHLIEEMHVTGYEGGRLVSTDAERKALIMGAISTHRRKGTKYAIRRAIESIGITPIIEEWFEYEGEPYHFRLKLDTFDEAMTSEQLELVAAFVDEYKNARSVLDGIEANAVVNSPFYIGTGYHFSEIDTIYPAEV